MLSRFFQENDDLLALYTWEPLEEFLNGIPRFQMIEKTFYWDAGPSKDRLTAENFGAGDDCGSVLGTWAKPLRPQLRKGAWLPRSFTL